MPLAGVLDLPLAGVLDLPRAGGLVALPLALPLAGVLDLVQTGDSGCVGLCLFALSWMFCIFYIPCVCFSV